MKGVKSNESIGNLKQGEFYILDAPGINGMGSNSIERMNDHIEAGGELIHKMSPDESGVPQLVNQ